MTSPASTENELIGLAARLGLDPQRPRRQEVSLRCPKGCSDGKPSDNLACSMSLKTGTRGVIHCFRCNFSAPIESLGPRDEGSDGGQLRPTAKIQRIDMKSASEALRAEKPKHARDLRAYGDARGWPSECTEYFMKHPDVVFAPHQPVLDSHAERLRRHARKKHRPYLFLVRNERGQVAAASRRGTPQTPLASAMMTWGGFTPQSELRTFGDIVAVERAAREGAAIVIVEGAADYIVASWWCSQREGYLAVGAINASSLPKLATHLGELLGETAAQFLLVPHLGDKDDVGERAMHRAGTRLRQAGEVRVVRVPVDAEGKGDLAQTLEVHGTSVLSNALATAAPFDGATDQSPAGGRQGPEYGATDIDNARRFVDFAGEDVVFVPERGWMVWDGRRFSLDRRRGVAELAKRVPTAIGEEADRAFHPKRQDSLEKWKRASAMVARQRALITLAQSDPKVMRLMDEMDQHPWMLNVHNGTLDLRSGHLLPHSREHYITQLAPVAYDAAASCPRWQEFLLQLMDGSVELVEYLQRAIGYTLTADTGEHAFFLLFGLGANGKSTFLEVVRALMGDYARSADFNTFLKSGRDGARNDLATLATARFVTSVEPEKGKGFAEATLKQITGGDGITARFLFKEHFEFEPQLKLWLAANHVPNIDATDDGIWRRVRLIPFEQSFKGREDRSLRAALQAELSGILTWAVEGTALWQRFGLDEPEAVVAATSAYRKDMDVLGAFLEERCVVNPHIGGTSSSDLYAAFRSWLIESGAPLWTQKQMGTTLRERGFTTRKSNRIVYPGIGLKPDPN